MHNWQNLPENHFHQTHAQNQLTPIQPDFYLKYWSWTNNRIGRKHINTAMNKNISYFWLLFDTKYDDVCESLSVQKEMPMSFLFDRFWWFEMKSDDCVCFLFCVIIFVFESLENARSHWYRRNEYCTVLHFTNGNKSTSNFRWQFTIWKMFSNAEICCAFIPTHN